MRPWAALLLLCGCIPAHAVERSRAPDTRASGSQAAAVIPGYRLEFPRDHGSHEGFRTEWWYVTGWLHPAHGAALGFQITFFRSRTDSALLGQNPSAFSPAQLLIAHAAISDPGSGRLAQDQRIARAGFGLAQASERDTAVFIDDWHLQRTAGSYQADIQADAFSLHLSMRSVQAPLLNGVQGYSRKSPNPASASYYYSIPHLRVSGSVARDAHDEAVTGEAWLDHEWSSEYLDADARGWDWVGLNFDDGSTLMAFRIRAANGSTRWAGGTLRAPDGGARTLEPQEIDFKPVQYWRSPRTGVTYPVGWHLRAGEREMDLSPLMPDQENDTRATTGAIYWEGAVRALHAGHELGRGYLELTGYGENLQLP